MFDKEADKMKKKLILWVLSVFTVFSIFQSANIVNADDDHEEGYEMHDKDWKKYDHEDEKYEDYDNDDEDYEEYEEYDHEEDWESKYYTQPSYTNEGLALWNIWTRDTNTGLNGTLPFQEVKEVSLELNNKSERFFIIPQQGQYLISGEKFAELIDAEFTFYEQSRIFEILKGNEELIVRSGSNAAYENMIKTPMPVKALYYEKSVFLPISVIANSMGYRVSWNVEKEMIVLEEIL